MIKYRLLNQDKSIATCPTQAVCWRSLKFSHLDWGYISSECTKRQIEEVKELPSGCLSGKRPWKVRFIRILQNIPSFPPFSLPLLEHVFEHSSGFLEGCEIVEDTERGVAVDVDVNKDYRVLYNQLRLLKKFFYGVPVQVNRFHLRDPRAFLWAVDLGNSANGIIPRGDSLVASPSGLSVSNFKKLLDKGTWTLTREEGEKNFIKRGYICREQESESFSSVVHPISRRGATILSLWEGRPHQESTEYFYNRILGDTE